MLPAHSTRKDNIWEAASDCDYAACYCEENVYKLCVHVKNTRPDDLDKCFAVFVSNSKKVVPLWCQKAGREEDKLVMWDYHVIFIYQAAGKTLVFDLDTTLPFPCEFSDYAARTFRSEAEIKKDFHRSFRVVPAAVFLQNFASDRRHMKGEDGAWMQPPPSWPCIASDKEKHNLETYISMEAATGDGVVKNLEGFIKMFDA